MSLLIPKQCRGGNLNNNLKPIAFITIKLGEGNDLERWSNMGGGTDQILCYYLKIKIPLPLSPLPPKLSRGSSSNSGGTLIALVTINLEG